MKIITKRWIRQKEEEAARLAPLAVHPIHVSGEWYLVRDSGAPIALPPKAREGYVAARLAMTER